MKTKYLLFIRNKINRNSSINIVLFFIFLIGFLIRLYKVDLHPPSLLVDEVAIGYNSFSLLETGKDEWNKSFPLIFQSYGDYKPPLYFYLTLINIFLVGLTPFAVRITSVLSGTILILTTYLIVRLVMQKRSVALVSAFLVAFSPWTIMFSRVGIEGNLACAIFSLGILSMLLWLKKDKLKYLVFCALFFSLALYSYHASKIIIPVFSLLIFVLGIYKKRIKEVILFTIIIFLFTTPLLLQVYNGQALIRVQQESLLTIPISNYGDFNESSFNTWPTFLKKIIFYPPLIYLSYIVRNITDNLSIYYLFFDSRGCYPEYCFPGYGFMLSIAAPFFILGFIKILFSRRVEYYFLLFWLLLGLLPSAIMTSPYQPVRSILILPTPMIFVSLGLFVAAKFLSKLCNDKRIIPIFFTVFFLGYFGNFLLWSTAYWKSYAFINSSRLQYGYRELVGFLKNDYQNYDKILITRNNWEPHEFILYWWPWDPKMYHSDKNLKYFFRDETHTWIVVASFDKFEFVSNKYGYSSDTDIVKRGLEIKKANSDAKILLVLQSKNIDLKNNLKYLNKIDFLNGEPAFVLYELN